MLAAYCLVNKMRYEILDLSKSIYQDVVIVESASPKKAAEQRFGKVKRSKHGTILVASVSSPYRLYLYVKDTVSLSGYNAPVVKI